MDNQFAGLGLAVDQPSRIYLRHPGTEVPLLDENKQQAYVDMLSTDSAVARQHERDVANRRLQRGMRKITAEELEADGNELLAKLTRGWHLVSLDGKALNVSFGEEAARALYGMPQTRWIRDQVNAGADERGNFKKA